MLRPERHDFDLTADPDDLFDPEDLPEGGVAAVDPEAAIQDYAELARLLRAADSAGDAGASRQIRDQMDELWPVLSEEQRARIEDGEFDW
jgi:hypothetical protein